MRLLGLDVGERRIGVAVSDPSGTIATPLTAIGRTGTVSDIDAIQQIARDSEACQIVVGIPTSLSGVRGPQAKRVELFVDALARHSDLPVRIQDERYSTVEAQKLLKQSGVQPSRDRARLDAAAAAVILQAYLDSTRKHS